MLAAQVSISADKGHTAIHVVGTCAAGHLDLESYILPENGDVSALHIYRVRIGNGTVSDPIVLNHRSPCPIYVYSPDESIPTKKYDRGVKGVSISTFGLSERYLADLEMAWNSSKNINCLRSRVLFLLDITAGMILSRLRQDIKNQSIMLNGERMVIRNDSYVMCVERNISSNFPTTIPGQHHINLLFSESFNCTIVGVPVSTFFEMTYGSVTVSPHPHQTSVLHVSFKTSAARSVIENFKKIGAEFRVSSSDGLVVVPDKGAKKFELCVVLSGEFELAEELSAGLTAFESGSVKAIPAMQAYLNELVLWQGPGMKSETINMFSENMHRISDLIGGGLGYDLLIEIFEGVTSNLNRQMLSLMRLNYFPSRQSNLLPTSLSRNVTTNFLKFP
jgi:hypothetical protein